MPLDRIVATAIEIVDEQGADALSMRTLAQRLESGTATLYRHFGSRAQLVAHVVDAVLGEVGLDAAELRATPWREAAEIASHRMFDVFREHPNVAPLLVEQIPMGPNAMAQRELLIALLLDVGFAPPVAAKAFATLSRYVLGFAIQIGEQSTAADLPETWLTLDPLAFPATLSVAEYIPVPLEREFSFGLELILDSLVHLLGHSPSSQTAPSKRRQRRGG